MDVFCLACTPRHDLYGVGSRDRTAWETSFRPYSLAISVAEPGSLQL